MKNPLLVLVGATLVSGAAWAQRVQNMDISFLAGPAITSSSTIPGSNVKVEGTTGYSNSTGYGYQIVRTRAGSLWIEFSPTFVSPGFAGSNISGRVSTSFSAFTLGLRLMVPVHSRISVYGALGGGSGGFRYPVIAGGAEPRVTSNSTIHGVFQFGGGVDFRLTRILSIRGEVRDFVTGSGLSGSVGPHHVVPLVGVALHF